MKFLSVKLYITRYEYAATILYHVEKLFQENTSN